MVPTYIPPTYIGTYIHYRYSEHIYYIDRYLGNFLRATFAYFLDTHTVAKGIVYLNLADCIIWCTVEERLGHTQISKRWRSPSCSNGTAPPVTKFAAHAVLSGQALSTWSRQTAQRHGVEYNESTYTKPKIYLGRVGTYQIKISPRSSRSPWICTLISVPS